MEKPAISLAPMEGITTYIYRRRAAEYFRSPTRFFTPYLSPAGGCLFTPREMTEILPENNQGYEVIPQLMVNNADLTIAAIDELKDMGYTEVNLNMGCPSGNVTRKRKGAGMLAEPESLDRFLDRVMSRSALPISVKTRIGMHAPEEFDRLLTIFARYPLKEMILHPRVRDSFYRGEIHIDRYLQACRELPYPVLLNGEIRSLQDIPEWYPAEEVMIGRGLIARPDLLEDAPAQPERIREFYRRLEEDYLALLGSDHSVLVKMKRIAAYRLEAVPHSRDQAIELMQAEDLAQFHRLDFVCGNFYNNFIM